MGDDRIEWVGEQIAERVDHPEQDARAHGNDRRHDLVGGEPRYQQTDGGERGCQEQERAQMPHPRHSGPSFVRPRKSASRSNGAGPMSRSPKPPATTAVASASAMGPIAASTK